VALQGLSVEVVQVTSDQAKGLVACAKGGLEAQHTPELFHGQRDLGQAVSLPLDRQVQAAHKAFVEVRKRRLSLYHHGQGPLSEVRLRALTAVHNYVLERGDGRTAAERFFGAKPRQVFDYLLERMPELPRPGRQRPWKRLLKGRKGGRISDRSHLTHTTRKVAFYPRNPRINLFGVRYPR
jgi:Family of unknown function (DUF6399)